MKLDKKELVNLTIEIIAAYVLYKKVIP